MRPPKNIVIFPDTLESEYDNPQQPAAEVRHTTDVPTAFRSRQNQLSVSYWVGHFIQVRQRYYGHFFEAGELLAIRHPVNHVQEDLSGICRFLESQIANNRGFLKMP
ncbi:MAG: hypothetical protein EHM14_12650 [Methanothrix sp.]|nr:MAG: hypothetical protein EHM14_12650 [Methanothrix sp.]